MRTEAQESLPADVPDPQGNPRLRRGRPLEMAPEEVLRNIRALAARGELFRAHLAHPSLYARARRQFGTWAVAVAVAGFDYPAAVAEARRRSIATRRRSAGTRPAAAVYPRSGRGRRSPGRGGEGAS